MRIEYRLCTSQVVTRNSKGKVSFTLVTHVLKDHINFDICIADGSQNLISDSRRIGDTNNSEFCFVTIECNARNSWRFHKIFLVIHGDECSGPILKTTQYPQRYSVLPSELYRAEVKYLRAHACHLQHFLKRNAIKALGAINDARICCINTINVSINLTLRCFNCGCQCNG